MKIIDLTHTLSENSSVHPDKTRFTRVVNRFASGVRLDDISMNSGIGTHMDSPRHLYAKGDGIDQIPLSLCYAPAYVIHLADKVQDNVDYEISVADLEEWEKKNGPISSPGIVLVHTGWDRYWGQKEYCSFDPSGVCRFPGFSKWAAEWLTAKKVNGVGIDTVGIDAGHAKAAEAHLIFLKENIFLLECVANLGELPPKGAIACVFPMKIKEAPEAPVRAVAFLQDQ